MTWRNRRVTQLSLSAQQSCRVTLMANGGQRMVKLKKGVNKITL